MAQYMSPQNDGSINVSDSYPAELGNTSNSRRVNKEAYSSMQLGSRPNALELGQQNRNASHNDLNSVAFSPIL